MATSTTNFPFSDLVGCPSNVLNDRYPIKASVAYPLAWSDRQFRLLGVRDLAVEALTVEQFLARPMSRRSRYQLRVVDMATGRNRLIYHRLLHSSFRECPLRVALFDGAKIVELLSTNWGATVADRLGLVNFLNRFESQDLGELRLGIFSDDGEVITAESLEFSALKMREQDYLPEAGPFAGALAALNLVEVLEQS